MRAPLAQDEYLIASDVANGLAARGFEVACAGSERAAGSWLDDNRPDVAIIDIQLLDGQRGIAASRLKDLGVPFIVHSGYDPAFQARCSAARHTFRSPRQSRISPRWQAGWSRIAAPRSRTKDLSKGDLSQGRRFCGTAPPRRSTLCGRPVSRASARPGTDRERQSRCHSR